LVDIPALENRALFGQELNHCRCTSLSLNFSQLWRPSSSVFKAHLSHSSWVIHNLSKMQSISFTGKIFLSFVHFP
jgi:hypothetical protein